MSRVAILVPWYRERLTDDEAISLEHLLRHLGDREIVIVKPEGLYGTLDGRPTESFADACFESVDTYSRLLLSADFYCRFEGFEWILLYQLDALVLSDRLDQWLDMSWDYIGAPWLIDQDEPLRGFSRVGNGGFCLRRVDACLKVLEDGQATGLLRAFLIGELPDQRHRAVRHRWHKKLAVLRQASRGVAWYTDHYTLNEDHFWCDRAHLFGTGFSVAPVDHGLRFAFERAPRLAYEHNGNRMPFGAHAWPKNDRSFWEPHLLLAGVGAESLS